MDGSVIGISIGIVINIAVTSFAAGKLYQKVNSMSDDINKFNKHQENTNNCVSNLSQRVSRIEGKMEIK